MAQGSITFGGLVSGLDTAGIVESLVKLKQTQQIFPIEDQLDLLTEQKKAYSPIKSALESLKAFSNALRITTTASVFNQNISKSSNTSVLTVQSTNNAIVQRGTYTISNISALAIAGSDVTDGVSDKNVSQFGTGTLSITQGSSVIDVEITDTNNTLTGIAAAINNSAADVTATIINDGGANPYRLVITSNETGLANDIDVDFGTLTLTKDAGSSVDGDDAAFEVNGIGITSASNVVSEAVQGVTFTLLNTEVDENITITVEPNTTNILNSITSFVKAYGASKAQLETAIKPDADNGFGPLGHDVTLSNANVRLNAIFSKIMTSIAGSTSSKALAHVGITTNDQRNIEIDSDVLLDALENNLDEIQEIFQGTATQDGIAEEMYNYTNNLVKAAGIIDKKTAGFDTSAKRLEQVIKERQERIDLYEQRLLIKFKNMESMLSNLENVGGQISSYFSIYSQSSNKLL